MGFPFQNCHYFCNCHLSVLCLSVSFPDDVLFPFSRPSLTSLFPSFCYQTCSGSIPISLLFPTDVNKTPAKPSQGTTFAKGKRRTCWMQSVSTRLCKTEMIHTPEELPALDDLPIIRMTRGLTASRVRVNAALAATRSTAWSGGLITPCGVTFSCEKAAQHRYECVLPIEEIITALVFCHSLGFLLVSTKYYCSIC